MTTLPDRLFKYATADVAELVLENLTFQWCSPLRFNDPYDTDWDLKSFFHVDEEIVDAFIPHVEALIVSDDPFPRAMPANVRTALQVARDWRGVASLPEILKAAGTALSGSLSELRRTLETDNPQWVRFKRTMRLFCLSEVNNSVTMWAYYAADHTGAVIALRTQRGSSASVAKAVRYTPHPPVVAAREEWIRSILGFDVLDMSNLIERVVFTKSDHWAPEQEWRCYRPGEDRETAELAELVHVPPDEICGLYLGARMASATREGLVRLAATRTPAAEVWQARLPGGYRIDFERLR